MKVLILDTVHPLLKEGLTVLDFEVEEDCQSKGKNLYQKLPHFQGVIIRSRVPVDKEFLQRATSLKFIGRVGAGLENIDIHQAEDLGIALLSAPEGNRNAVGEHALGMLLMLMNNLRRADAEVRNGEWRREENRGHEIEGRTVGIIGFGNMGSAFAETLRGFDCTVLAYDKYKKGFGNGHVKETSLEELRYQADIVSLHVPQTAETIGMVDDDFINAFHKSFYLINTARGTAVKTSAVVNGLKNGRLSGACLDVLEYEKASFENIFTEEMPADFEYLIHSDKVVLSPHIAGWSYESNEKMARVILKKIDALKLMEK